MVAMCAMTRSRIEFLTMDGATDCHTEREREAERKFRDSFTHTAGKVVAMIRDDGFAALQECAQKAWHDRFGFDRQDVSDDPVRNAALRGRHHAFVYATEAGEQAFTEARLNAWFADVETWASSEVAPGAQHPPPRLVTDDELGAYCRMQEEQRQQRAAKARALVGSSPLAETASEAATSLCESHSEPPSSRRLQLTRADQIEMRPPHWLLRGMLERDTFALVFGEPGCGKSFLAIDWACRIATGTPWRGHAVNAAPVVYVAGEGQQGFGRRIRAWSEHSGVSVEGAPLFVGPSVAIPDMEGLTELVLAIRALPEPPALIVLDTLARCFGGGDENSTQDMSKFVSACDVIRQYYRCTILVVHHTGHADKSRARGAIALKAALDAEYRLTNNEVGMRLTATKMKDAEMPPPVGLELVAVELPDLVDDYGNPVTSAAIEVLDAETGAIESKAKSVRTRGKWQDVGFAVARRLIATSDDGCASIDVWRDECQAAGMVRQNQHRVLEGLVNRGDIAVRDGALRIVTT